MSEYHSTDFSFDEWAVECQEKFTLPEITPFNTESDESKFNEKWDSFFSCHNSGNFFKPRRYLALEFKTYLEASHVEVVCEVGCGHGCSMYPLLDVFGFKFIPTDYSQQALEILKSQPSFNTERVLCDECWDVTQPPSQRLIDANIDVTLCIFAISAIMPEYHRQCFENIIALSSQRHKSQVSSDKSPVILFRDYAIHDMTMYRHNIRYSEHLYRRNDGTLAYYFTKEYIASLCESVGLEILELEYATVEVKNRKNNNCMRRVFLHGVFRVGTEINN